VEGIEGRPRDQSRLICDPQMSDRIKGVCKDDPSIPKSDLEDGSILLCQLGCHLGMTAPELQKIAKNGNSRYLREILDLGSVCSIQIPDESVDNGNENECRSLES
jgi:hypothetical protein